MIFLLFLSKSDENLFVDLILLVILIFGFFKGYLKGFVSTIFSLLSALIAVFVSWNFLDMLLPVVDNFLGDVLRRFIDQTLTNFVSGTFNSVEAFKFAIEDAGLNIFGVFEKLFAEVSFEGNLTAGQILSPILTDLLLKVVSFSILFLISMLLLNLIKLILNKFIKVCGLSNGNKFLGACFGLLKGFLFFLLVFFIISSLANLLLNQTLLNFVNDGIVSKFLYDAFYNRVVLLF